MERATAKKEHFWRGPINSPERATLIVRWAGCVFLVFGLLSLLSLVTAARQGDIEHLVSDIIVAALFLGPSVTLLWINSRVAAGVLFAMSLLAAAASLAGLYALRGERTTEAALAIVFVLWALLSLLTWRAIRATMALRRMKFLPPLDAVAATFD